GGAKGGGGPGPVSKPKHVSQPSVHRSKVTSRRGVFPAAVAMSVLSAAIGWTLILQARYYLGVPPRELTIRYKGGRQWVVLRDLGRDVARRAAIWDDPHLYVWGWQSPLHFYSKLDSPTRHFFVDNLLRDHADHDHPLIQPRIAEIMSALRQRPPELIFTGYPPFRTLLPFLFREYFRSQLGRGGLWVRKSEFGRFESQTTRTMPVTPSKYNGAFDSAAERPTSKSSVNSRLRASQNGSRRDMHPLE